MSLKGPGVSHSASKANPPFFLDLTKSKGTKFFNCSGQKPSRVQAQANLLEEGSEQENTVLKALLSQKKSFNSNGFSYGERSNRTQIHNSTMTNADFNSQTENSKKKLMSERTVESPFKSSSNKGAQHAKRGSFKVKENTEGDKVEGVNSYLFKKMEAVQAENNNLKKTIEKLSYEKENIFQRLELVSESFSEMQIKLHHYTTVNNELRIQLKEARTENLLKAPEPEYFDNKVISAPPSTKFESLIRVFSVVKVISNESQVQIPLIKKLELLLRESLETLLPVANKEDLDVILERNYEECKAEYEKLKKNPSKSEKKAKAKPFLVLSDYKKKKPNHSHTGSDTLNTNNTLETEECEKNIPPGNFSFSNNTIGNLESERQLTCDGNKEPRPFTTSLVEPDVQKNKTLQLEVENTDGPVEHPFDEKCQGSSEVPSFSATLIKGIASSIIELKEERNKNSCLEN